MFYLIKPRPTVFDDIFAILFLQIESAFKIQVIARKLTKNLLKTSKN